MKMPKLPKKPRPGMVVGVAWYREADWPRVKELFPDADELHDSYAEWLQSAEDAIKQIKRTGVAAEPFVIESGILAALRRSPLVGADLDVSRSVTPGRKLDL